MDHSNEKIVTQNNVIITNRLANKDDHQFKDDIMRGLKANPKYILSKFLYDENGSEIFEAITNLAEYYPTRTEKMIISSIGNSLSFNGKELNILELGSGDSSKMHLLLDQLPEATRSHITYCPVDISKSAIMKASHQLVDAFEDIKIEGIVGDFINELDILPDKKNRLICFFGNTIGNLNMQEIESFMAALGKKMQVGESLLLGLDLVKDHEIIERAYNDSREVNARFNKNILNVVNNLTGSDFQPEQFEHLAFYNADKHRIEMHLKAKKDMIITLNSGTDKIKINKGEAIHTENSYKFTPDKIRTIGFWGGLDVEKVFTDNDQLFSLVHYRKNGSL